MSACAILGDSLAKGLAAVAASLGCDVSAVVGRNPDQIAAAPLTGRYEWAVISAGSNPIRDRRGRLLNETPALWQLRASLHAERVVWIVPAREPHAGRVRAVAGKWGDQIQGFAPARDNLHPRTYQVLWRETAKKLGVR